MIRDHALQTKRDGFKPQLIIDLDWLWFEKFIGIHTESVVGKALDGIGSKTYRF